MKNTKARNSVVKRLVIISVCVIALIAILLTNGWRLLGFSGCTDPSNTIVNVKEVNVANDEVHIKIGPVFSSMGFCAGYITEVKDDNLYVGLKYNSFIGKAINEIKITKKNVTFNKIYIKGPESSKLIWEKDKVQ